LESTVRIIVTPSATRLPPETPGSVVVGGSHSAIFTVYLTARARARAAIMHDAGIGLDQAGVSGLAWAEKLGMAVAAVAAGSARIGDGDDMVRRGVLSRVNRIAAACGVTAGMTCRDAAERLRNAPLPHTPPEPREETRYVHEKAEGKRRGIASVDSVALMTAQDEGQVMATGSHAALRYCSKVGHGNGPLPSSLPSTARPTAEAFIRLANVESAKEWPAAPHVCPWNGLASFTMMS